MTPAELNRIYATLRLVIKKASSIQADSLDKHMYHTDFKKRCSKNARDILIMAEPALTLIEEQRKAFRSEI